MAECKLNSVVLSSIIADRYNINGQRVGIVRHASGNYDTRRAFII
jgi:hypothetical protein